MSWNPFKKKDDSQALADLIDELGTKQQGPQLGAISSSSSGMSASFGSGIWAGTSGTTISASASGGSNSTVTIQNILSQMINDKLSQQERDELESLRKDHELEIKKAKLEEFKNLPKDLRQQIVNAFLWQECQENMNNKTLEKTDRLKELELKEQSTNSPFGTQHAGWGHGITLGNLQTVYHNYQVNPTLPNGITIEDLKQAHLDRSMEEELLGSSETP